VKVRATDIISQLKDFGCDLDKFSTDGVNAVYLACHTAAEDKTVTPVISLMQLGARIDRVDPVFYRSALHKACDEELPEICRFLVLSKASVVLQDKQGDTPLHIVAKRGSTRTLEVICQALVGGEKVAINPDREKEDLEQKLEKISELADEAKIKSIMSIPDPAGDTPLHVACSFGYEMLVNMLIRNGADPEKKNFPSRKGVAQDANARPDKKSKRKKKNQDAEDESKAMGAQGGGGKTPYHVTAEVGHTELFKIFVRKGIDTSGVDENGHTCLHYAAMNNDVEIAEIQFECDPNPNVLTTAGWTPLHYAAAYDSVHVIVFLLDAGADPTIENNQGHTPSMLAGRSRTKKALEGLLKETLKREELEREQRERALLEDRKRLMAEMENEAALRNQQKQPLLSPRHDSDEEDEVRIFVFRFASCLRLFSSKIVICSMIRWQTSSRKKRPPPNRTPNGRRADLPAQGRASMLFHIVVTPID
jgi:ankyrin repeat protein